jgi:hypothetical protein
VADMSGTAVKFTKDGAPVSESILAALVGRAKGEHDIEAKLVSTSKGGRMAALYQWVAGVSFKYVGSMFMEQNGSAQKYVMSLGRVALFALLVQSMWIWHTPGQDIVPGMKEALFALMAYTFGTKSLEAARAVLTKSETPRA